MTEDQGPPRLHPVEQPAPVRRLDIRPFTARDEERLVDPDRAHRPYRRVDAAGNQLLRAVPELTAG